MVTQRRSILPTVLAAATFFLTANVSGQVTTGQISGSVLDPSRAAVRDAVVTARSQETNAARKILTDRGGWFSIPELPVGSYEVTVGLGWLIDSTGRRKDNEVISGMGQGRSGPGVSWSRRGVGGGAARR
jgi:hypothetical protein